MPNLDSISKLVEALSKLVGVLIWPLIALFVLIRFGPNIGQFISSLGDISLKFAGFEASATRQKDEAAAALVAAEAQNPSQGATPEAARFATKRAIRVVGDVTPRRLRQIDNARVLWVDDRPSNNVYERQALEAMGVGFTLATSTDDALDKLKGHMFDLIISDMGRPPDDRAGYTLLDKLRSTGDHTPFIIYAGSNSPEMQAEAKRRGAAGSTNRPTELFNMVLDNLPH